MTDEKYLIEIMIETIVEKIAIYKNVDTMTALKEFYSSQTYAMLQDPELVLWELGNKALFDIWLNEVEKGNPRLSDYI